MSTDTPVILVVQTNSHDAPAPGTLAMLRHLAEDTPVALVLLRTDPDVGELDLGTDWDSIITNSGKKDQNVFRVNALDILTNHSNMVPVGVIDLDPRFEKTWDLPILKHWSELV